MVVVGRHCRCESRRIAVEVRRFRAGTHEGVSGRRCGPGGAGGEAQLGYGAPAGAVRTGLTMGGTRCPRPPRCAVASACAVAPGRPFRSPRVRRPFVSRRRSRRSDPVPAERYRCYTRSMLCRPSRWPSPVGLVVPVSIVVLLPCSVPRWSTRAPRPCGVRPNRRRRPQCDCWFSRARAGVHTPRARRGCAGSARAVGAWSAGR